MAITASCVAAACCNLRRDLAGGLGGLIGERLDLLGDDREALAGIARACGFDRGVEGQQVGLPCDRVDEADDSPMRSRTATALSPSRWSWSLRHGLTGDGAALLHLTADLADGGGSCSEAAATPCTLAEVCSDAAATIEESCCVVSAVLVSVPAAVSSWPDVEETVSTMRPMTVSNALTPP